MKNKNKKNKKMFNKSKKKEHERKKKEVRYFLQLPYFIIASLLKSKTENKFIFLLFFSFLHSNKV